MSEKPTTPSKEEFPNKESRQSKFRASVAEKGLSLEAAVDEARLIPKHLVSEFRVLWWPR
jgi:hypothetical protein